jgi:diguanylate cyclase (GGDEF)-like protein
MVARLERLLSGDLSVLGGPEIADSDAGRVRAEQIAALGRYTRGTMVANVCIAIILVAPLYGTPARAGILVWAFAVISYAAFIYLRNSTASLPARYASKRSMRRVISNCFLLGSLWGSVPILFFSHADAGGQMLITCLYIGFLCSGAFVLASIPAAAMAFMVPIFVGESLAVLRSADHIYWLVAFLLVIYTFVLTRAVVSHGLQFVRRLVDQYSAERVARKDSLTNLPNRFAFDERIDAAVRRLERGDGFAVFYLDLDDFKNVNDQYGHAAGDEMLVQVADRLTGCVRAVDTVARLGGDEFALIEVGVTRPEDALVFAERIVRSFSGPFVVDGARLFTKVSIGIALAPANGSRADVLMRHADTALYLAKREGKGSFRFFEAEDNKHILDRRAIETDLRSALRNGEFALHFEPVLALAQNRVACREAVLKWNHPSRGEISADQFMPIAEETGMMFELSEFLVGEACRAAASWPQDIDVAVNFPLSLLRSQAACLAMMKALATAGLPANRLEIELRDAKSGEMEAAGQALANLVGAGISLTLDDFGRANGSLESLLHLPVKRIKLGPSLITGLDSRQQNAVIVRALLRLATDLGMESMAEAVETEAQLSFLSAHGCTRVQGPLIGAVVPEADLQPAFAPGYDSTIRAA